MKLFYCKVLVLIFILLAVSIAGRAQALLERRVTVDVKKRPVQEVLHIIEQRGDFTFSYNSAIIPKDSLVTLIASNRMVKDVLPLLFGDGYEYKEMSGHVIILPAEKEKWYTVTGYVADAITGARIADASVFERQQLVTTLTDQDGHFRLRIKDKGKYSLAQITISKGGFYSDTSLSLFQGFEQEVAVTLTPTSHILPDVLITQYGGMERSWFGKFLLSSKLRKQSQNLGKFFVDKPVQASFVPGIGTHGKLSGQVTNKFSFNVLGGYTAGVDGFELGGLFNINKKDVRYAQVGGLFNAVSGGVTGVQVGGIANKVGRSVNGLQISGIASLVRNDAHGLVVAGIYSRAGGTMKGMQLSGIINLLDHRATVGDVQTDTVFTMKGLQLAGITNIVNENARGVQLSGIMNISRRRMKGLQMSGICNIAGMLEGTQIGLINIADSIDGYSIGLINIVKKGYHTLAVSTNDLSPFNLSYKTGNKKLYSILSVGLVLNSAKAGYVYGFGIGTEKMIKRSTAISIEFSVSDLYRGEYDDNALLTKLEPAFNWNIGRKLTLYTGPSLYFIPHAFAKPDGLPGADYHVASAAMYDLHSSHNTTAWVGWQVGFHIF